MSGPDINDRHQAIKWALSILDSRKHFAILDTETTGLSDMDEIIQVAILGCDGTDLFDSLVHPMKHDVIPAGATKVHGLTMDDLRNAASWKDVLPLAEKAVGSRQIIAYNAPYDRRMVAQSCFMAGIEKPSWSWHDAMKHYAAFRQEWNGNRNSYRWQKLPGAQHDAMGDCRATLEIIRTMAETAIPGQASMF